MKLHGNAAAQPDSRRRMVCRVVEQGWSLTKAAEARRSQRAHGSKWVARYRAEGEAGLLRSLLGAAAGSRHRTPRGPVEAIAALRRLRMTGAEIAALLWDGAVDGLGGAGARRVGQAQPARAARAAQPLRAPPAGELLHIDVKKLGRDQRRRASRQRQPRSQNANRRAPPPARPTAGSSCTSASTTPPAWPTSRCSATRRPPPPSGSCAAPWRSTPPTASPSQRVMTDNGSAYRSTAHALACRALGHPPPAHPPLPAPHQRQSRDASSSTMLAGWAYGAIYGTSPERAAALDGWLWTYSHRRPDGALCHNRPLLAATSRTTCRRFDG